MATTALGLTVADLVGVGVFALSGGLAAVRRHLDVVGVLVLGSLTALGGGAVRDALLGRHPPLALADWRYVTCAAVGALVAYRAHPHTEQLGPGITVLDAAGLALFTVTGVQQAHAAGLAAPGAVLLGVTTGAGGGVLRDVLSNEVPLILRPGELYALAAGAGAALTVGLLALGVHAGPADGAGGAVILALRLASLRFGWLTRGAGAQPYRPLRPRRRPGPRLRTPRRRRASQAMPTAPRPRAPGRRLRRRRDPT